jgi:hypothetical protein
MGLVLDSGVLIVSEREAIGSWHIEPVSSLLSHQTNKIFSFF